MIFGGVEREHLQLNEDTLWAGGPYDPNNTNALAALPEARQLVFDGKYDDAAKLISKKMMAQPLRQMPYETVGDLFLDVPDERTGRKLSPRPESRHRRCHRQLHGQRCSLQTRNVFQSGGPGHRRASDCRQAGTDFLHRRHEHAANRRTTHRIEGSADTLVMSGVNGEDARHPGRAEISGAGASAAARRTNHSCRQLNTKFPFDCPNADSVTLLIAAATSYKNYHDVSGDPEAITKKQIAGATQNGGRSFR